MSTSWFSHHEGNWPLLASFNVARVAGLALGAVLLLRLLLIIYRIYLHPLRSFPGPTLWTISDLPYTYINNISGNGVRQIAEFHRTYGPIVRVGPNRLALDGSVGWTQVFARRPASKPEYEKTPGYFAPGVEYSIIGSPHQTHRRQRKQLGHAFSDAVMHDHEKAINSYVQLLVRRIQEHADSKANMDIVKWVNFTTFDIIGDLTYGEPFGSLESSHYHPWVLSIFTGIKADSFARACRAYPIMGAVLSSLFRSKVTKGVENRKLGMAKGKARMELGVQPKGQKDFTSYMMQTDREGRPGLSPTEIMANSPILVVAGSETTASALSAFFFYVNNAPWAKQLLVDEIRSAFSDESGIILTATAQLEYLHAVIEETLRMYPPAPHTPSRSSPGATIEGRYIPKGVQVSVSIYSTFRNPEHFAEPDSFRPERWLKETHPLYSEKFASDNHDVFKPFSFGPRDCIGKNLAYSEMRLIISNILYRFDFEVLSGQEGWHDSQVVQFIWSKGPLYVAFKRRTYLDC